MHCSPYHLGIFLTLLQLVTSNTAVSDILDPSIQHNRRDELGIEIGDPEPLGGGGYDGGLSGGFDKFDKENPSGDGDKPAAGDGTGTSGGGGGDAGTSGSGANSQGVVSLDVGDGIEAKYNKADEVTEIDVSKTCGGVPLRRRSRLARRDPPCMTEVKYPAVAKYNRLFKKTQESHDVAALAEIKFTNSEVDRALEGVDPFYRSNFAKFKPMKAEGADAATADKIDLKDDSAPPLKADFIVDEEPNSAQIGSPDAKTPLTANSPNTGLLRTLDTEQVFDLYLRQIERAQAAEGDQIANVLAAQRKWLKYLGLDLQKFLRDNNALEVSKSQPVTGSDAGAPDVGNLEPIEFTMADDKGVVYEAEIPDSPYKYQDRFDLSKPGPRPKLAQEFIAKYKEYTKDLAGRKAQGDVAARQLEKAGGLKQGTLSKVIDAVEVIRSKSGGKLTTRYGYVFKADGAKITILSEPLTTGMKAYMGVSIVVVAGATGYQIVWDNTH